MAEKQYLLAEMPDGGKLIHEIPDRFIKEVLGMGRRPIASLLSSPEREDWRQCVLSNDDEKKLATQFKSAFKKYDFTA
jgi:hypothetical protein